ncbi:PA0061/PA0062 family lipoprotein [Pseudomonas matsuisoli]|uniref:PA0061/PA0062 family lipoprotein n=1 Tax=Pseudomonas matsuisoli TaxID=1515666 RepID=UPI0016696B6F|nr:hypothetical protein [Pseudomonas matsuisoli]
MRPFLVLLTLLVAGCAGPLPKHNPDAAWIEFYSWSAGDLLMAERLDGKRWPDGRYFQVSPGAHALEVRYRFELQVGGVSGLREPSQWTCFIQFRYDDFAAGKRYRVEAREVAMRPQSWLYDSDRNVLVEGDVLNCGPFG